jgi:hypothetical protein
LTARLHEVNHLRVHLHPESLLITAAVLIPNLLFLILPPKNAAKYGKSHGSLPFTIMERVGQVGSFVLPLFFPLSFSGTRILVAWVVMGTLLVSYYALWIRFFVGDRNFALLFRPILHVPVPMAISPVLYFLLSSVVLGSVWQAIAAALLGVGHITVSAHESHRLEVLDADGGQMSPRQP